ncbi:MAG: hypothetical protein PHF86_04340 [Candidatus Nanoarchaeia archaeon]|jgi:alpha-tubulin suppressor-like RCC1 family protein|nr:hypothetical protein [Candidatus Nanoarchaeia archaeon]
MFGKSGNIAYKSDGSVWSWGQNSCGQLGDNGSGYVRSSPVLVVGDHKFYLISAGRTNTVYLKQDGSAWCNGIGNGIGDDTTDQKNSPVAVIGNHSFVDIDSEWGFCMALKSNGEAWGWGYNIRGNLGNNSTTHTSSPVQVVGNHSFIKVQCAGDSNANGESAGALKADGSLWGWGMNAYGSLGNGDSSNKSSPVVVVGNHSFIDFAISPCSRYGLKANGEVWSWGANYAGQLGTGNTTSYTSPVLVIGNHSFIKIALSLYSNRSDSVGCAGLKSDGTVWTWGNWWTMGNNSITATSSPVSIVGDHSFVDITGGAETGFFSGLKSNGEIWSWGVNSYGQLGDLSLTNRSSPVLLAGNHSFISLHTGMNMNLDVSGSWKRNPIIHVNVEGTWKRIIRQKMNINGTWTSPIHPD